MTIEKKIRPLESIESIELTEDDIYCIEHLIHRINDIFEEEQPSPFLAVIAVGEYWRFLSETYKKSS